MSPPDDILADGAAPRLRRSARSCVACHRMTCMPGLSFEMEAVAERRHHGGLVFFPPLVHPIRSSPDPCLWRCERAGLANVDHRCPADLWPSFFFCVVSWSVRDARPTAKKSNHRTHNCPFFCLKLYLLAKGRMTTQRSGWPRSPNVEKMTRRAMQGPRAFAIVPLCCCC